MGRQTVSHTIGTMKLTAAVVTLGLALAMAPVTLSIDTGLDFSSAAAKSDKSNGKGKSDKSGGKSSGGSTSANAGRSTNSNAGGSTNSNAGGAQGGNAFASSSSGGGDSGAVGKPKRTDWSTSGLQQYKEDLAAWKAEIQKGPNLSSRLGALNAAHASPTALLNAAPNSQVGLIAIYKNSVEAASGLQTQYDEAVATLDGLTEPDSTTIDDLEQIIANLEAELVAATAEGATDTRSPEEIDAELFAAMQELEAYKAGFTDYYAAADDVERLAAELEAANDLVQTSLEDAANKPVDEDVQQAVNDLLGL